MPTKKKKEGKELSRIEIMIGKQLLNKIKLKNVNPKSILKIARTTKQLTGLLEDFGEAQQKIFEAYDLKPNEQNMFEWSGHKEEEAITKAIGDLNAEKFMLTYHNFMTEEEFEGVLEGSDLTADDVVYLQDLLVKE